MTVGPRAVGGLDIPANVAETTARRKACVQIAPVATDPSPSASDVDVERGAAVAAMVGVAEAALFVGIELAAVVPRRRGDALGRLDRRELLIERHDKDGCRHRGLQQGSRSERHCRQLPKKTNLAAWHEWSNELLTSDSATSRQIG